MKFHIASALANRLEKTMKELADILEMCEKIGIEVSIPDSQHNNSWIGIEPKDIRGYEIKMNIQRPTS